MNDDVNDFQKNDTRKRKVLFQKAEKKRIDSLQIFYLLIYVE